MALALCAHGQSGIHVDVVTGQVQADQALEDDAPSRPGRGQEDQQTGRGTSIGYHVENCSECGGLVESSGSQAIEGI